MDENVDFKELYLREKIIRLQLEMSILQSKFSEAQAVITDTKKELEEYLKTKTVATTE